MTDKDEDQGWLDALAGKHNPDADPEVSRRAALLRRAIQRHDTRLKAGEFDVESGLQKLRFRMQREGLRGSGKTAFFTSRFAQYAIAASIVLTIGLTMRLYLHEQPTQNEAEIMRGSSQQIVLAPDPEARLKQLATELDQLGIKYQIERKDGKILLKAAGIDPANEEMAGFLERNHITPPVGMEVELDIRLLTKP